MFTSQKRGFGRRVNDWLYESPGQIFRSGKWRFWYPVLAALTALTAVMTAIIFGQDGMQKYIGSIMILAGAVLCWLGLGLLHYSDSDDRLLAIGVAALDSLTLLFVAAHFSFLLYCQTHLSNLRAAETKYTQDLAEYNKQIAPISADNARITAAAERIAEIEKQTERLRNDTAYWSKRNGVKQAPTSGLKVELSTTKVDLPPPPKAPAEASADFLSKWDQTIRLAGFGELALSIITLIFVRNRTAATNARKMSGVPHNDEFPDQIEAGARQDDRSGHRLAQTAKSDNERQSLISGDSFDRKEARKKLLAHLRVISHYNPGRWFKADLVRGGVEIRMFKRDHGHEISLAKTTQSDKLLAAVDRPDFRDRLREELRYQGFEI